MSSAKAAEGLGSLALSQPQAMHFASRAFESSYLTWVLGSLSCAVTIWPFHVPSCLCSPPPLRLFLVLSALV